MPNSHCLQDTLNTTSKDIGDIAHVLWILKVIGGGSPNRSNDVVSFALTLLCNRPRTHFGAAEFEKIPHLFYQIQFMQTMKNELSRAQFHDSVCPGYAHHSLEAQGLPPAGPVTR